MKNLTLKQLDALDKLSNIVAEVNEDWEYTAGESYYYPIFNFDNDFSFNYVADWSSRLLFPAPLVFKSKEICERVVRENFNLYSLIYLSDDSHRRGDKVEIKGEKYELLAYENGNYIAKTKNRLVYIHEKDLIETRVLTKEQAIETLEKVLNCKIEIS